MTTAIHPSVDRGIQKGSDRFAGGTLRCLCAHDAVEVRVDAQVAFNHACGCTRCWKPAGERLRLLQTLVTTLQRFHYPSGPPELQVKFSGDLSELEDAHVEATLRGSPGKPQHSHPPAARKQKAIG